MRPEAASRGAVIWKVTHGTAREARNGKTRARSASGIAGLFVARLKGFPYTPPPTPG
jgi:hypothetical protein